MPVRNRRWLSVLAWVTPIATAGAAVLVWTTTPVPRAPSPPPGEQREMTPTPAQRSAPKPLEASRPPSEIDRLQPSPVPAAAPERRREEPSAPKPLVASEAAAAATAPASPAPAAPPALAAPAASRQGFIQVQSFAKSAAALNDIAAPDNTSRWRFSRDGRIERTTDGGATWQIQARGFGALAAGAAPAATICWIVGDNGIVLRSTDGASWERVTFPEPINLADVRASDGMNATVTSADGRTFTTHDGGRTWQSP